MPGSIRSPRAGSSMPSMRSARTSPSPRRRRASFSRPPGDSGLRAHVHAGQLSDMGAAELAARHGALSADHLEYLSERGARALGPGRHRGGAVARRLFHLAADYSASGISVARRRRALAVSTDGNPGTSPGMSLLLALNMACSLFGLTPEEALAGATRIAARALGRRDRDRHARGGKRADFALWRIERPAELCYNFGSRSLRGSRVPGRGTRWARGSRGVGCLRRES